MGEWILGIVIREYIGTTIGIHSHLSRGVKVSRRAAADSNADADIQTENLQHDALDTKAQSYLAKELQRVLRWYEAISLEAERKLQAFCFDKFGRVNVPMRDHPL